MGHIHIRIDTCKRHPVPSIHRWGAGATVDLHLCTASRPRYMQMSPSRPSTASVSSQAGRVGVRSLVPGSHKITTATPPSPLSAERKIKSITRPTSMCLSLPGLGRPGHPMLSYSPGTPPPASFQERPAPPHLISNKHANPGNPLPFNLFQSISPKKQKKN